MTAAAFFDLDMTICAQRTENVFGRHLFDNKEISTLTLLQVFYTYLRYELGLIPEYDAVKRKLVGKVFRGKTVERINEVWDGCYQSKLAGSVYPEIRKCIDDHKSAGREIHVVSASLDFIAQTFCDELGIDGCHATELEVHDGVYSGTILGTIHYEKSKGEVVSRLAQETGLDLQQSYAYGDHFADRFMLEAVGNPVAVNPDKKLAKLASDRGWQILSARAG